MSAICPECDSPIDVDEFDVDIGDELTCSECGTLLRVSSDSPLAVTVQGPGTGPLVPATVTVSGDAGKYPVHRLPTHALTW